MAPNYLSQPQAAAWLEYRWGCSVSPRTIEQWRHRGYGPSRIRLEYNRAAGRVVISTRDLRAFAAAVGAPVDDDEDAVAS